MLTFVFNDQKRTHSLIVLILTLLSQTLLKSILKEYNNINSYVFFITFCAKIFKSFLKTSISISEAEIAEEIRTSWLSEKKGVL